MKRLLLVAALALALPAQAYETTTLPRHAWLFDFAYLYSFIDKQWDGNRKGVSLIEDIRRYEPGGGLQGILRARPRAEFDFLLIQALYGVTDHLTAGVYVPIAMRSRVTTNLAWEPGDYQAQLGRQYSEEDFWQWAASMGQPRVPAQWQGGVQLSDIVLIGRYLLPEFEWMKQHHFRWSGTLLAALPTGSNFDPEEAVSVGTNLWELNAAGDVEVHLSADKAFFVDDKGLSRINVGADLFYAFLRPREYRAGTGTKNPLLNNIAPYVGEKYIVDGGDWLAGALSVDLVPFIGPSRASIVSGYSAEKAETLPPMVTLNLSYTHVRTMQSDWRSESALWDWDREKYWQPGEKNLLKATLTLSLLRVGLPLQVYASYRSQDIIPGRYTRPANVVTAGVKLLAKFW